jgi:uncharacterized membrane protein
MPILTASIVVHTPARDVYQRWTRFHDFPLRTFAVEIENGEVYVVL